MRRVYKTYDDDEDDEITVDMMIDRHEKENARLERISKRIDITIAGILVLGGIAIGAALFLGVKNLQKVKAGQEITKTINVIPTDKLDAECFSTSITTGDDSNDPESFRAVSIDNVYCKPNTESLAVKNKHGIGVTIYEGDESNQILYYKEFKEGNNIFYFNIRERN